MKRFLWTWVAAAAVVGLALFTVYDGKRLEKKEQEAESQKTVVQLPIDTLTRIEIKTRVNTTVLEKDPAKANETAWKVTAPFQDEADSLAVESLLNQIEAEKSTKTVVEGDKLDLKAFGLDDPITRLKVSAKDGRSVEVRIGSVRAYDGSLYAQLGEEKRVLLVSAGWDLMLAKLPKEFRNKRVLRQTDLKLADLGRIVFKPAGAAGFELVRGGENWEIKGAEKFPVDKEKVSSFFSALQDFRVRDFLEGGNVDKARSSLAKTPARVAVFRGEGAEPVFTMKLAADPSSKSDEYFGQSSDVVMPAVMARNALDVFDKTAQDFYDRKLPFRFAAGEVAKVEVASEEFNGSFEKKGDTWSVVSSDLQNLQNLQKKADSAKLNGLVERLSQMEAFRILPAASGAKSGSSKQGRAQSRIALKKADGTPVFELTWGDVEVEKASGHRPEARYLRALTKTPSEYRIGIAEGLIKTLDLAGLVAAEPTKNESKNDGSKNADAKATPQPGPKTAP